MSPAGAQPTVAVVGAGLAGLAAACALAGSGFHVTLFERRPYVGGRASSYEHPGTGETVDNCQHVLLGCCTNLIGFYRRIGAENNIRWYDRLNFVEPGGRVSVIHPSGLPAPLHSAPSFLASHALEFGDKLAIARAMLDMSWQLPPDTSEDFLSWLKRHGQTPRAIERFWKVVLVSALNEDLNRVSVRYGAQVFRESFLKSAEAGRMGVPSVPLSQLYGAAADYIRSRGGEVRLRTPIEKVEPVASGVALCSGGTSIQTDFAVLAVPFQHLAGMLPDTAEAAPLRSQLACFETSPITGIHFWFDHQVTDLDHAVLLDRTIQWMFHKSRLLSRTNAAGEGSYLELVVSSSKSLVEKPRNEILDLALAELREFFPAARDAKVLKSAVIKEVHATYSVLPRSDRYRPSAETVWPRLFLAGDWTATGWPATMEGAVRSGYRAAEGLTRRAGRDAHFCGPDLPAHGLMRLFERR